LRGTTGGTALKNALLKLAKPSSKGSKLLEKYGIEVARTNEGSLNLVQTFKNMVSELGGVEDKVKKTAIAAELFGLRGQGAFVAIENAMKTGKLDRLLGDLNKQFTEGGAAQAAAAKRLDNFKGQITLLKSALEGFALETAGLFLKGGAAGIKTFTKFLGEAVTVMQLLNSGVGSSDARIRKFNPTVVAIAEGIIDGFKTVIKVFGKVKKLIMDVIKGVTGGAGGKVLKMFSKWATIIGVVVAAVAPLALALGGIIIAIAFIAPALKAVLLGVAAGIGIATQAVAAIIAAITLFGQKGESVGKTIKRIFLIIKAAIIGVIENAIKPFIRMFVSRVMPTVRKTKVVVLDFINTMRRKFQEATSAMIQAIRRLVPIFKLVFKILGFIVGEFVKFVGFQFRVILAVLKPILSAVVAVGKFLVETAINSLIAVVTALVKIADAVGSAELVPQELRDFIKGGEFKFKAALSIGEAAGVSAEDVGEGFFASLFGEGDVAAKNFAMQTRAAESARAAAEEGRLAAEAGRDAAVAASKAKTQVNVNSSLCTDGREQAIASARHTVEVNERAGFKASPWQRRIVVEQGAVPVGTR
jgi:hypothetical protein